MGMSAEWVILHAGALGDLVLTLQLALRITGRQTPLHIIGRTTLPGLANAAPPITCRSAEGLSLHWLHRDDDDNPPTVLREALAGRNVLSALGGTHTIVHHRLQELTLRNLYSIDPRPQPDVTRHITHQWQTQLEAQRLLVPKCVHHRPEQIGVGVPPELRVQGRARLVAALPRERATRPVVAIHPGSGGRAKCWSRAAFADVARTLQADGCTPLFIVGPVELDTWSSRELTMIRDEFPLLTAPPPEELVAVLSGVSVYVGNDGGVTHVAALLGTPTVVLFGPTDPRVWRPLGPRVVTLQGSPCCDATWRISPTVVVQQIHAQLGGG